MKSLANLILSHDFKYFWLRPQFLVCNMFELHHFVQHKPAPGWRDWGGAQPNSGGHKIFISLN